MTSPQGPDGRTLTPTPQPDLSVERTHALPQDVGSGWAATPAASTPAAVAPPASTPAAEASPVEPARAAVSPEGASTPPEPARWDAQPEARPADATTVLPEAGVRRPGPVTSAAKAAPSRPAAPRPSRPAAGSAPRPAGRTRKARLALKRVDPWSVFVFSLVASLFLGVALVVAVGVLYAVLSALGVPASVNELFAEVSGEEAGTALLTSGRIVGGAAVLGAVNVVLLTLLATLGALLYNVCASFTGGIELTLGERDG